VASAFASTVPRCLECDRELRLCDRNLDRPHVVRRSERDRAVQERQRGRRRAGRGLDLAAQGQRPHEAGTLGAEHARQRRDRCRTCGARVGELVLPAQHRAQIRAGQAGLAAVGVRPLESIGRGAELGLGGREVLLREQHGRARGASERAPCSGFS